MAKDTLLKVEHLKQYFEVRDGFMGTKPLKAVDDISFEIKRGETLGLVGESGCGKTTAGKSILQLYKPTGGKIYFEGKEIKTSADINEYRKQTSMVFQDPYSSLDPRMTVAELIAEPLRIHKIYKDEAQLKERILELMKYVGLNSEHATRYAHEFSGGQRQRIGIARSLALNPKFIVCDEAVSALDVSIQAQVVNLFKKLQKELNLTYLFVSHDLLIVRHMADKIAVMYLGKMVELGQADDIFYRSMHPYSRSLLSAVPEPDPDKAKSYQRIILKGDIPSPLNAPSGCPFRTRCPYAKDVCAKSMPDFSEVKPDHFVACHRIAAGESLK